MNILLITQKVDRNDSVLGFFHQWIIQFAGACEKVTVICLEEGEHELPENVTVYSLGKEKTTFFKRPKYVWNFYRHCIRERRAYDAVFVHMNPEYAVLGGILWRLQGKKVALWYNHKRGGPLARLGAVFAHQVFYTSSGAYMSSFKKARVMPAGVDTDSFALRSSTERAESPLPRTVLGSPYRGQSSVGRREPNSILSFGRISPVKHVGVIIDALARLNERGVSFSAHIYGDPTPVDMLYYGDIRRCGRALEKGNRLSFHRSVPYREAPAVFSSHEFFVNATTNGSFDKTVLEAALSGAIPIVCNESFADVLPPELFFKGGDARSLALTLELLFTLPQNRREEIRRMLARRVKERHGLNMLVSKILASFAKDKTLRSSENAFVTNNK